MCVWVWVCVYVLKLTTGWIILTITMPPSQVFTAFTSGVFQRVWGLLVLCCPSRSKCNAALANQRYKNVKAFLWKLRENLTKGRLLFVCFKCN
jgi:hypothetical protein